MNRAHVDRLYNRLIKKFVSWAEGRQDIRAALIVGSRARVGCPPDQWSDLDLLIVTSKPEFYVSKRDWIENMGTPLLTFIEPTSSGEDMERRVLYEGIIDVDYAIIPVKKAEVLRQVGDLPPQVKTSLANTFGRGVRVLIDKDGLSAVLKEFVSSLGTPTPQKPSKDEFLQVVNDFLYHAVFVFKHLRRGELWWAKMTSDCYMSQLLLRMIEWHAHTVRASRDDTWFRGRFLEKWADPEVVENLRHAFAHYEEKDINQSLIEKAGLFCRLATETAEKLGYDYPIKVHEQLIKWMKR